MFPCVWLYNSLSHYFRTSESVRLGWYEVLNNVYAHDRFQNITSGSECTVTGHVTPSRITDLVSPLDVDTVFSSTAHTTQHTILR